MMATKKRLSGNQFFWITWFGDRIVLGDNQKTFISKLMVEMKPLLLEQQKNLND